MILSQRKQFTNRKKTLYNSEQNDALDFTGFNSDETGFRLYMQSPSHNYTLTLTEADAHKLLSDLSRYVIQSDLR